MKRFNELPEPAFDHRVFERVFSGRMTKKRWQIIDEFCRRNTYDIPVYSDHDCTGKLCGQAMHFLYKKNITIRLSKFYDV